MRPIRTRHSDWCGLAGIVQAIVETFPKNCALMFPPIPVLAATPSFTSTFKPASSDKDDDDNTLGGGRDFCRFETSTPTPADGGHGGPSGSSGPLLFSSGPLPYGGTFIMVSDNVEAPSETLPDFAEEQGENDHANADDELDLGVEADDEGDGTNKINPANLACINTVDHSKYLEVACADPGSVVTKSVFSLAAYRVTLEQQGGDIAKFDKEVGSNFKKGAKGSRAPDSEKVPIDRLMLVCQWENGIDVAYSDPDGFGRLVTMGLWDLHSTNALSRAKMQLPSGHVDANFCLMCAFWSTNNETLNNHVHKHYRMGLTCHANGFTMASMAAMKAHMESAHGYKGKHGQAKKAKRKC